MSLSLRPTKITKTDLEGSQLLRDLEQKFLVEADEDVPVDVPFSTQELGCYFASECTGTIPVADLLNALRVWSPARPERGFTCPS